MAIDGLVKKKQVETDGSKLKIPGFKAAGGKINDEVKNRIVEAIKKGGTQPSRPRTPKRPERSMMRCFPSTVS